jgi:hypothetical protein
MLNAQPDRSIAAGRHTLCLLTLDYRNRPRKDVRMSGEYLQSKLDCQDLMFRYAVALDNEAEAEALSMWTEDGRIIGPDGSEIRGTDEIRGTIEAVPLKSFAPRILTNVLITVTGDDTARGFAYVTLPKRPKLEWHFEFLKTSSGWLISSQEGKLAPSTDDVASAG